MEQNIVSGSLSATRPQWDGSRLVSRIVHGMRGVSPCTSGVVYSPFAGV
ncbi:hypothetical protein [Citrobacter werkmanii]|nr:hypothetical protein [Citrobacter werkmanii]